MRTLKFRAWGKYWEEHPAKMHYFASGNGGLDMATGKFFHTHGNSMGLREYPDLVVMQFTGLLDKNGKEIYEGDIVNVDGREDPHLCEFVQKDSGGRFQFTHPKKGVWSCFPKPKIEIIGNIYSNPKLLK